MSVRVSPEALLVWLSLDDWNPSTLEARGLALDLFEARLEIEALEQRTERLKIAEDSALTKLQNVLSTVGGPVWVGPLHATENWSGIPGGKIGRRYFFDKHEDSMSTAAEFDAESWAAWRTEGDDGGDNDPTEWGYSQGDAGFDQMDARARGQLEAWGIEVRDAPSTEAPHG